MLKLKPLLLSAFIALPSLCLSEDQPFNGLLLDASGMPIKNAKIYVTSPDRYAKTDKKGKFGLTNVQSTDTLKIKIKKRKSPYLIPAEGSKGLKIYLADQGTYQISPDEEMASIGYGWVKRREYTGSSAGISGDDLRRTGKHDILSALQGKVAGMNITGSGTPWSENQVTIRGQKSIYLSSTPLFVVDGIVVDNFDGVSIYDVDRVEVLKEAPIYGSRGANGAILVFTKGYPKK